MQISDDGNIGMVVGGGLAIENHSENKMCTTSDETFMEAVEVASLAITHAFTVRDTGRGRAT